MKLNKTFELNGKAYQTDEETLNLLTKLNNNGNNGEAHLVFTMAKMTGRIVEIQAMAEYTVDAIGTEYLPKSETHGQFVGYASSTGKSVAIPQRKSSAVTVDMEAVEKMQQERNERLARMENGGSYWS